MFSNLYNVMLSEKKFVCWFVFLKCSCLGERYFMFFLSMLVLVWVVLFSVLVMLKFVMCMVLLNLMRMFCGDMFWCMRLSVVFFLECILCVVCRLCVVLRLM